MAVYRSKLSAVRVKTETPTDVSYTQKHKNKTVKARINRVVKTAELY
jgi:hypothetical protein